MVIGSRTVQFTEDGLGRSTRVCRAILVFILYCCKIHRLFQAVEHENSPMAWNIGGLLGLYFIKPFEGVPAHAHAHAHTYIR